MRRILFVLLLIVTNLMGCSTNENYRVDDIRVFENTPVWKLAKAIDKHDIKEVEKLLKKNPDWVDYQEPEYGVTLLYWTIFNTPSKRSWEETFYKESKLLIAYGANPYQLNQSGYFPLQKAADIYKESKQFIELCLSSEQTKDLSDSVKKFMLNETLLVACGRVKPEEVESVKLLVEHGANVNYFNADSTATPFCESITHGNMNTAKYLIMEQGAEYDIYVKRMVDGVKMSMLKRLLDLDYSEEPEKQKLKEELVLWIEQQENEN